jgi:predicted phage tail protein
LHSVLKWAYIEQQCLKIEQKLATIFGTCVVVQHFSNRLNLKVERSNKSIGFVFGVMEELKEQMHIVEYSATQTTLEQIFNMFA